MPFDLKGVWSGNKKLQTVVYIYMSSESNFVGIGVCSQLLYQIRHCTVKDSVSDCGREKWRTYLKYGVRMAVDETKIIENHYL